MTSPEPVRTSSAFNAMRNAMQNLPVQNIAEIAEKGFGRSDIIPLWFGEGDLPTPAFIGDAASAALKAGHTFYTDQNGIPELREALSAYLTRLFAKPVGTNRITVTPGGMAAILIALEMIIDEGDNIIGIDPVWPNTRGAVQILGGTYKSLRMDRQDGQWRLDFDKLAEAVDGKTKAIFFASPGNPTGWVMDSDEQAALLEFCRARGLWILADEVYSRFHYGRNAAPSMLDHAEPEDRVFVINSFSKSWCMTGWRMGWLTHPPSAEHTAAMLIQYNTSGVATFLQHGGVTAINDGEDFVAEIRARTERGRDIVVDGLRNLPRIRDLHPPEGAMYAYFRVDGMTDSRQTCEDVFERTGIGLAPGFAFGDNDFLRLCFCNDPEKLAMAVERLRPEFM
ncbi:MAG: pyridoxal phosphate-dependent aminotransferase [Pseudomonadota bacterium]